MNTLYTFAFALFATIASVASAQETASKTESSKPAPTKELSVPPISHVTYPKTRPDWVDLPADLSGSATDPKTKHKLVVVSSPADSAQEADADCELLAKAALLTYCSGFLGIDTVDLDPTSNLTLDELISRRYAGTVSQGDTKLFESAWELTVDDSTRKTLMHQSKNHEVRNRLALLGFGVAGGFLLLLGSGSVLSLLSRRVEKTL
jgi:hypothetical protein